MYRHFQSGAGSNGAEIVTGKVGLTFSILKNNGLLNVISRNSSTKMFLFLHLFTTQISFEILRIEIIKF